MIVNCFTVRRLVGNNTDIDTLYKEFGQNLPNRCPYEGSHGLVYLCCVDVNISVKEICEKYDYECHSLYEMEIDPSKYNSAYTIYPTYRRNCDPYNLEKK
jgi:hypothetical protein